MRWRADTPDPASPLPAPSNYTYSSVGPLSPYLTQTSPPSMATSPPPTPTSATSQATKPSVSNVGPLVLRYQARPSLPSSSVHGRSMVAHWSLIGRSMVARLLWPPALSHRPKGGGKGRAAIYLGARPFWAPAQKGRSGLFKTARFCYRNYIYLQLMSNPCQDSKYCSGKFNKQALDIVKVE